MFCSILTSKLSPLQWKLIFNPRRKGKSLDMKIDRWSEHSLPAFESLPCVTIQWKNSQERFLFSFGWTKAKLERRTRWIRFMYPYVLLESWIICYSSNITCAKSFHRLARMHMTRCLDFRVFFLSVGRGRGSSEWWKDGKISFSHRLPFIVCVAAVMKSTNPSSQRFPTLRLISINTIN